jgi:hypothetical protein
MPGRAAGFRGQQEGVALLLGPDSLRHLHSQQLHHLPVLAPVQPHAIQAPSVEWLRRPYPRRAVQGRVPEHLADLTAAEDGVSGIDPSPWQSA